MVFSCNDWDPLEELVLGSADGLGTPPIDTSLQHFYDAPPEARGEVVDPAALARVIEETNEDLAHIQALVESHGVRVRRPEVTLAPGVFRGPGWESANLHQLMPRDCILVVGDTIIETPMPAWARFFETVPFRPIMRDYFDAGANLISAPKPVLDASIYEYADGTPTLADIEPMFDAANILRCGTDIFYNLSNTGNEKGAMWLERVLGPEFTVHRMAICPDHVGTTLHILRPGLLLANSGRMTADDIPQALQSWDRIWVDEPHDDGFAFGWARGSRWVGMNVLALSTEAVLVPAGQPELSRSLAAHGIEPIEVPFRHGRTIGGGIHCCSLDVRRRGELGSYL